MKNKKRVFIIIGVIIAVILIAAGIIWYKLGPVYDENNAPKIVKAHMINPEDLEAISKFRSGAGHDFSTMGEICRSMKHYFMPKGFTAYNSQQQSEQTQGEYMPPAPTPDTAVSIYSPVDGKIGSIASEQYPIGKQISISVKDNAKITMRLFHVYPADGITEGMDVTAGQKIGEISKYQQTDIAVQVLTRTGIQMLSYYQVMPDSLFADYAAHGITDRSEFIITKKARDAKPLSCNGEQFTQQNSQDDWVSLK